MIQIDPLWIYFDATAVQAKRLDAIFVTSKKLYKVPNTLGALKELHEEGFNVAEYGKAKLEEQKELLELKSDERPTYCYDERLRPYQNRDIEYLSQLPHAGIFNEQRTGKSPTTIKLLEAQEFTKIVVVCPATLVLNWKKEIETWSPGYPVTVIKGSKKQREKKYQAFQEGYLLLSYETLRNDIDLLTRRLTKRDEFALVVDEAHRLRNYKSNQTKAIYELGKAAKKRLALTGTPTVNSGADLWGILHFLYPKRFNSYWQFAERYFKTYDNYFGGKEIGDYKREKELQDILSVFSVQRKRSEVMKWLPAKQYQTITLEMEPKQRKAYKEMLDFFVVTDEERQLIADAPSVLAQLTRLRQICLDPSLLGIEAPSAKENFLLEWLEDNGNNNTLIFCTFSSYLVRLQRKIKGAALITGDTPKPERQRIVEEFQAGRIKTILANIQAAGTGLTLDKADTVLFLDRDYTPVNNVQAEDRAIATAKDRNLNCTVIDIICKDSVDEMINAILKEKKSVIQVVNNYRNIKEFTHERNYS